MNLQFDASLSAAFGECDVESWIREQRIKLLTSSESDTKALFEVDAKIPITAVPLCGPSPATWSVTLSWSTSYAAKELHVVSSARIVEIYRGDEYCATTPRGTAIAVGDEQLFQTHVEISQPSTKHKSMVVKFLSLVDKGCFKMHSLEVRGSVSSASMNLSSMFPVMSSTSLHASLPSSDTAPFSIGGSNDVGSSFGSMLPMMMQMAKGSVMHPQQQPSAPSLSTAMMLLQGLSSSSVPTPSDKEKAACTSAEDMQTPVGIRKSDGHFVTQEIIAQSMKDMEIRLENKMMQAIAEAEQRIQTRMEEMLEDRFDMLMKRLYEALGA